MLSFECIYPDNRHVMRHVMRHVIGQSAREAREAVWVVTVCLSVFCLSVFCLSRHISSKNNTITF